MQVITHGFLVDVPRKLDRRPGEHQRRPLLGERPRQLSELSAQFGVFQMPGEILEQENPGDG